MKHYGASYIVKSVFRSPFTKVVITQATMGQIGPNFQEILRRHSLISQHVHQEPTCPPRLQLLDLEDR